MLPTDLPFKRACCGVVGPGPCVTSAGAPKRVPHMWAQGAAAGWDAAVAASGDHSAPQTPSAARMLVGACPRYPGGFTTQAAQSVVDVWGKGAAVRVFG